MMVPFRKIDPRAAFAAAFEVAGMPWMRVVVALGALLGIVTGVLVGMMAVARIFSAVGRAHLVFPVIGHVHHKYKTPAIRWAWGFGRRAPPHPRARARARRGLAGRRTGAALRGVRGWAPPLEPPPSEPAWKCLAPLTF
jgi:hypothetical protein